MTVEELLIPRWLVIADFPFNEWYVVNDILLDNGKPAVLNQKGDAVGACNFKEFPHIFKPLGWWQERAKKDLPSFVKNLESGMLFKCMDIDNHHAFLKGFGWDSLVNLLPATEAEYLSQLNPQP